MSRPMMLPAKMVARKPPHGSPCTRCGLCCYGSLCPLAVAVFGQRPGPCPALAFDQDGSLCGLVTLMPEPFSSAAALLIGSGTGCDARINGEPVNDAFNAKLKEWDRDNAAEVVSAARLWAGK